MEKHTAFLRFIILEKLLLGIVFAVISLKAINLIDDNNMELFTNHLLVLFNVDIQKAYIQELVDWMINAKDETILGFSALMFLLSVLNLVESYGLMKRRRWAEWLTVIATSLFIPLEIYEVIEKQTLLRVGALIVNVAIVYYLAKHKELFYKKNWFSFPRI